MKIKEVSQITGIPKRTIHFYVDEKLIFPSINQENKYYDFSESDCQKLMFIREMRNTGLSIPEIQSIMKTPETASFYMNRHIKKLKNEKRHIEQVLVSLKYIMDEMPLFPNFSELNELCSKANIPSIIEDTNMNSRFDNYNTLFINKLLWSGFLPKTKLTDYQEFLWMKLNKITFENPSEEYTRAANFLYSLSHEQIDSMATHQNDHFRIVASLDENGIQQYTNELIKKLKYIISVPEYCYIWRKYYHDYFYPSISIQTSNLSTIMKELSPLYEAYVKNINIVCENAYQYLYSEKGKDLLDSINKALDGYLNIEDNFHGELETLSYIPDMMELLK